MAGESAHCASPGLAGADDEGYILGGEDCFAVEWNIGSWGVTLGLGVGRAGLCQSPETEKCSWHGDMCDDL